MSRSQSLTPVAAAVLVALVLVLPGLGGAPLDDPGEGQHAEIAREISAGGGWVTLRLNGVRYFDKPPLLYWLTAASFRLFGPSEWAARLAPLLGAVLAAAGTAVLGARLLGLRGGVIAAGALLSSALFVAFGRYVRPETLYVAAIQWGFTGLLLGLRDAPASARRRPSAWPLVGAAALGVASLVKDPVGLIGPLGAVWLALALARRARPWVGRGSRVPPLAHGCRLRPRAAQRRQSVHPPRVLGNRRVHAEGGRPRGDRSRTALVRAAAADRARRGHRGLDGRRARTGYPRPRRGKAGAARRARRHAGPDADGRGRGGPGSLSARGDGHGRRGLAPAAPGRPPDPRRAHRELGCARVLLRTPPRAPRRPSQRARHRRDLPRCQRHILGRGALPARVALREPAPVARHAAVPFAERGRLAASRERAPPLESERPPAVRQ